MNANNSTHKYFSGSEQLQDGFHSMNNAEFAAKFPGVKGLKYDSFSRIVGMTLTRETVPVTRIIRYSNRPSLHKCDGRCRSAKGPNCECQCGGTNHGAN